MEKVSLYVKEGSLSKRVSEKLLALLEKNNFVIDDKNPEVVFVIGGDGTFLRAMHKYLNQLDEISFLGINTGSLGHFCEFSPDELESLVSLLKKGELKATNHRLLTAEVKGEKETKTIYALNEIRIQSPFRTLEVKIHVNNIELEDYHGDGLIASTSLGSTGYNKSLGGAIIDPKLDLIELTGMATIQNNVYRSLGSSIIFDGDSLIKIEGVFTDSFVAHDYLHFEVNGKVELLISLSPKEISILRDSNKTTMDIMKESFVH